MNPDYAAFLAGKQVVPPSTGMADIPTLSPALFEDQRVATSFALRRGTSAIFLDTGMGKTGVEAEWARVLRDHRGLDVIWACPLACAQQHIREAERFGVEVRYARNRDEVQPGITITNIDRLESFDLKRFRAGVLDESSILKSYMGRTKRMLVEGFAHMDWRLAGTATPAPNDHVELGNHSEFLGVMPSGEMLTRWFINNTKAARDFRLKRHAVQPFWNWVADWALCAATPADLGCADRGFAALPPPVTARHTVRLDLIEGRGDRLFRIPEMSATSMHAEKRRAAEPRARRAAELVTGEPDESWLIWCDTDYEADALEAAIPGATGLRGSESIEAKERKLLGFSDGSVRRLVTKPSIAGFGLNWQHCARVIFAGLSFSYEAFYQARRRTWRFGQRRTVHEHVILADTEAAIWSTIAGKQAEHETMKREMAEAVRRGRAERHDVRVAYRAEMPAGLPAWMKGEAA